HPHAQQCELAYQVQIEQRVGVADASLAPGPMRLPPQMKCTYHLFHRIDQVVSRIRAWLEAAGPMRPFQLVLELCLVARKPVACKETIPELARQQWIALLVFDWLFLAVQKSFNILNDVGTAAEK